MFKGIACDTKTCVASQKYAAILHFLVYFMLQQSFSEINKWTVQVFRGLVDINLSRLKAVSLSTCRADRQQSCSRVAWFCRQCLGSSGFSLRNTQASPITTQSAQTAKKLPQIHRLDRLDTLGIKSFNTFFFNCGGPASDFCDALIFYVQWKRPQKAAASFRKLTKVIQHDENWKYHHEGKNLW